MSRPVSVATSWLLNFALTPGRFHQFARYMLVSGVALGVDLSAFAVLTQSLLLAPVLAGALSMIAGLIAHYVQSVVFVFSSSATGKSHRRLIVEYGLTGLLGVVITILVIVATVDVASLPVWLGKLLAVGATFVCVYLVRAGVVFAPQHLQSAK